MLPEDAFAAKVDQASPGELLALLTEGHAGYQEHSAAATVRMRGWALLALGRQPASPDALLLLLEELDAGVDPYLIAAAARALRSAAAPTASLTPYLAAALERIRHRDEPVSFEAFGEYAVGEATDTSPVRELLRTVAWLGPLAHAAVPAIERLRHGGVSIRLMPEIARTLDAISTPTTLPAQACCALPTGRSLWAAALRHPPQGIVLEDDTGTRHTYAEAFHGHVTIAVFFYTRCDNPLKCSLSITRLARLQQLLAAEGLAGSIHTAAITYDAAYDLPARLRQYTADRGLTASHAHRTYRTVEGFHLLRQHLALGVNFVESLVNRHRIEAYILDAQGRVAASFTRLQWDEGQLLAEAVRLVEHQPAPGHPAPRIPLATSLALALLPKCPFCWSAYLSAAGLAAVPYAPLLYALLLLNLAALAWRARSTGNFGSVALSTAGAVATVSGYSPAGAALVAAGSLWSVRRP